MNKFSKSIFAAAMATMFCSLFVILPCARAEVGTINLLSGGTHAQGGTITNATTRTTGFADVKVEDQEIVSLQINASGTEAGTGALTMILARSKDGVTFETSPRQSISFSLAGATTIVGFTNLVYVGAAHSLRLISVQNADANASATNVTISVVKKRVSVK